MGLRLAAWLQAVEVGKIRMVGHGAQGWVKTVLGPNCAAIFRGKVCLEYLLLVQYKLVYTLHIFFPVCFSDLRMINEVDTILGVKRMQH